MEAEFRKLIPITTKCAHDDIFWDILGTTSNTVRVRVTCRGCRRQQTGTVSY